MVKVVLVSWHRLLYTTRLDILDNRLGMDAMRFSPFLVMANAFRRFGMEGVQTASPVL